MASKKILVILCSVISLVICNPAPSDSYGEPDNSCPDGAEMHDCSGCGSYCPRENVFCPDVCIKDCVCTQEGYVIGPDNTCIPKEECPSETKTCPEGTAPSGCVGCWSYCPVPGIDACAQVCREGCACIQDGYVIGPDNTCIPKEECPSENKTCPEGTAPSGCVGCWSYCPVPGIAACPQVCANGCACIQSGYVIGPDNTCIPKDQCPEVKYGDEIENPLIKGGHDTDDFEKISSQS